eukprot:Gb_10770 [translate_table: standard]
MSSSSGLSSACYLSPMMACIGGIEQLQTWSLDRQPGKGGLVDQVRIEGVDSDYRGIGNGPVASYAFGVSLCHYLVHVLDLEPTVTLVIFILYLLTVKGRDLKASIDRARVVGNGFFHLVIFIAGRKLERTTGFANIRFKNVPLKSTQSSNNVLLHGLTTLAFRKKICPYY